MRDMEQFKNDYPEMYERFLKMNNALAALQKAMRKGKLESGGNADAGLATGQDLPDLLELE